MSVVRIPNFISLNRVLRQERRYAGDPAEQLAIRDAGSVRHLQVQLVLQVGGDLLGALAFDYAPVLFHDRVAEVLILLVVPAQVVISEHEEEQIGLSGGGGS